MENQEKKMIAYQVGYLQDLRSRIIASGKAVLTKKDSTIIEEISQTVNSLKLFTYEVKKR